MSVRPVAPGSAFDVTIPIAEWTRVVFAAKDSDDERVKQAVEQAVHAAITVGLLNARPPSSLPASRPKEGNGDG